MLIRRIARPLLATWFVTEGIDAVRHPAAHAQHTEAAWSRWAARVDALPDPPGDGAVRTVVQVHGAARAGAGLLLALGRLPRLSALTLAVLTVPLAIADAPVRTSGADVPHPAAGERFDRRGRFTRDLSMVGAAILAALDRQGRPSLGWKLSHSAPRHAELTARKISTAAGRTARSAERTVRRSVS